MHTASHPCRRDVLLHSRVLGLLHLPRVREALLQRSGSGVSNIGWHVVEAKQSVPTHALFSWVRCVHVSCRVLGACVGGA